MTNGLVRSTVLALLLSAGLGCTSGQTGSPDCVGSHSCVCDPLSSGGVVARVRVASYEGSLLSAEVIETVKPSGSAHADLYRLEPGEKLGGILMRAAPCGVDDTELVPSTELLVSYDTLQFGNVASCVPFHECAESRCQNLSSMLLDQCWATCTADTAQTCDELRRAGLLDGLFNWAVPWGEQLDFGEGHQLESSELSALSSYQSCVERFPVPAAPPCDDTSTSFACSTARPGSGESGWAWGTLCGVLGAGLAWLLTRRLLRIT